MYDLGLDDTAFLSALYREVLHREIDDDGLMGKLNRLANGGSRFDIVQEVVSSAEFLERLQQAQPYHQLA